MKEKLRLLYKTGKWYIFAAGAVMLLGLALIAAVLTGRQTVLAGVVLNCDAAATKEASQLLSDGFLEYLGIDPAHGKIQLAADVPYYINPETPGENFATLDALTEYTSEGRLDFLAGDAPSMENLAYSEFFEDLRGILPPEQLESLSGQLRYMDLGVVRQLEQMAVNKVYPEDFTLPDPGKPEEMEEPVPIFVDVTGCKALEPYFGEAPALLAVARNTGRPETTRDFVEYLARSFFRNENETE